MRWFSRLSTACAIWLAVSVSGSAAHDIERLKLELFTVYEGEFHWPELETTQSTFLVLDKPTVDQRGWLVARGKELYRANTRYIPIDVELSIDPVTLRVELTEIPGTGFAVDDTRIVTPIIATISPDLKTIKSDWMENDSLAAPDFVLTAK